MAQWRRLPLPFRFSRSNIIASSEYARRTRSSNAASAEPKWPRSLLVNKVIVLRLRKSPSGGSLRRAFRRPGKRGANPGQQERILTDCRWYASHTPRRNTSSSSRTRSIASIRGDAHYLCWTARQCLPKDRRRRDQGRRLDRENSGRLAGGLTNQKKERCRENGLQPFVKLCSGEGPVYSAAGQFLRDLEGLRQEIVSQRELRKDRGASNRGDFGSLHRFFPRGSVLRG